MKQAMNIVVAHKKSVSPFKKIGKLIKNVIKKVFRPSTKVSTIKVIIEPEAENEVNDNTLNEAIEARLRQMIIASPVSLDPEVQEVLTPNTRGSYRLKKSSSPVHFATFWTEEDEEDMWDLYPELCKFNSNMIRAVSELHRNATAAQQ